MVNDSASYVYLTDGGQFDNTGLYALIRRRCSTIIICDCEEDGLIFKGISAAIRKCRIDYGTEITLDVSQLEPSGTPPFSPFSSVPGRIYYPNGVVGELLYIKAIFTHDLPTDIDSYGKENESFPNQSTADRRFSETQFESYRRLGQHYAMSARVTAWLEHHLPIRPV